MFLGDINAEDDILEWLVLNRYNLVSKKVCGLPVYKPPPPPSLSGPSTRFFFWLSKAIIYICIHMYIMYYNYIIYLPAFSSFVYFVCEYVVYINLKHLCTYFTFKISIHVKIFGKGAQKNDIRNLYKFFFLFFH